MNDPFVVSHFRGMCRDVLILIASYIYNTYFVDDTYSKIIVWICIIGTITVIQAINKFTFQKRIINRENQLSVLSSNAAAA